MTYFSSIEDILAIKRKPIPMSRYKQKDLQYEVTRSQSFIRAHLYWIKRIAIISIIYFVYSKIFQDANIRLFEVTITNATAAYHKREFNLFKYTLKHCNNGIPKQ